MGQTGDITEILQLWREGDAHALERLAPLVHTELLAIARGYMRRERDDHTLQPTALVSELYLRLINQREISWTDRIHFYTFSAHMMRNLLKDHARAHIADRRGGKDSIKWQVLKHIAITTRKNRQRYAVLQRAIELPKVYLSSARQIEACYLEWGLHR